MADDPDRIISSVPSCPGVSTPSLRRGFAHLSPALTETGWHLPHDSPGTPGFGRAFHTSTRAKNDYIITVSTTNSIVVIVITSTYIAPFFARGPRPKSPAEVHLYTQAQVLRLAFRPRSRGDRARPRCTGYSPQARAPRMQVWIANQAIGGPPSGSNSSRHRTQRHRILE